MDTASVQACIFPLFRSSQRSCVALFSLSFFLSAIFRLSTHFLRCFHCLRLCLRQNLLLVRPGPFVRAIAGVGKPGSTATPAADPRKCVSVLPVFPLFSPATNTGGMANKRSFFKR